MKISDLFKNINIKVYGMLLLFLSCNDNNVDHANLLWDNALEFHEKEDLNNCVVTLHKIIETYPQNKKAHMAYYFISEIYLNEYKEYDISISFLKKILNNYPKTETAKKALFTLGYINANYIDSFSDAINNYKDFLKKYPNDDLIPSVEYELENLSHIDNQINLLSK